jgi:hypothetical protein
MDRVSEPTNSGPCRFCWGDHTDESCRSKAKEYVDVVSARYGPKEAMALEMWSRKQFIECRDSAIRFHGEGMGDHEIYDMVCIDCEYHDECFETPEWYKYLEEVDIV